MNGSVVHDAGCAVDVVGVRVGQDQQRHVLDVEASQAAVDQSGLGAGVHDDGLAGARGEGQRVALAYVAGHHVPARRGPGGGQDAHRDDRGEDAGHGRDRAQAEAAAAQEQDGGAAREQERHGAGTAGGQGIVA